MTLAAFALFVSVYTLAAASPGPAVAAIVARTLGQGTRGALAFIGGLLLGDLTWFAAATLGLSLVAQTYAPLFQIIKYAGAAYLLYVAWSIWRAPAAMPESQDRKPDSSRIGAFFGAYFLTLGNPKTMVFFVSIMPLVVVPEEIGWITAMELAATISVLMYGIFLGYVFLASRARRMLRSPRALKRISRATAGIMAGTAAVVATR